MLYRAGYAETMIGEPHRHLETPELDHVGQYSRNLVPETSCEDELAAQNAMGEV